MPASDPLSILLAHDRWATRQILDACTKLTHDQFHQRFDLGPGSLHDTLTHILGAMRTWTHSLAHQELGPRLEQDPPRSPAELLTLLDQCSNDFESEATRLPLDATISRIREGHTFTFTRGAVLTHVATHGMHHRAQCLNMLRQLGVKPLPPSSIAEWTRIADIST